MRFPPPNDRPRPVRVRGAFTLPEMMVSVAIGGMIVAAVASLSLFSARSMVAMGNYIDLDKASRHALDHMSLSIRQTAGLKSYSATSLTFTNKDNTQMAITWNPSTRLVTLTEDGNTRTLLTQCDYLQFNISQRNPSNSVFGFYPASDAGLCKLVDVSWRCSRTIFGHKVNTESVQTAKIVIRN